MTRLIDLYILLIPIVIWLAAIFGVSAIVEWIYSRRDSKSRRQKRRDAA